MIGTRLGPYEIVAKLGEGGMGVVYRAHDARLGREVALKVLPGGFTQDPDRLARFEREAKLLAQLNHSHIAQIYGFEVSGETRALVMELVEGPTLAERIESGPLSITESLSISLQIAQALEAAHEKGIVHRDLKPQNVKISKDGSVKVLDFGLGKLTLPLGGAFDEAPTVADAGTASGVVLGTVGYMAPEQVRGERVDARCDLFALGCVLYEMLTGERAFGRATGIETLNAILKEEPRALVGPGSGTPAAVARVVRHCLEKHPARRYQSAHDLAFDLEALSGPSELSGQPDVGVSPRRWQILLPWCLVGLGALLAGVALWRARHAPAATGPLRRFVISTPLTQPQAGAGWPSATTLALSPDGTRLAYVVGRGLRTQLHLRPLDALEAVPIVGTEGASAPFFSRDGHWIGFFGERQLKKVNLGSGEVVVLCDAKWPWGATWGADQIFFTPGSAAGLWSVSPAGGEPRLVAAPDYAKGERSYRFPEILPGDKALLYTLVSSGTGSAPPQTRIGLLDLSTGNHRVLIEDGSSARYVPTGHLLYARSGALLAVPFDLERLAVNGPSAPVIESLFTDSGTAAAQYSLASDGTLVYVPGGLRMPGSQLMWVARDGTQSPLAGAPRNYANPSLAPDGRRLALVIAQGANADVWVLDLARGTFTRLTVDAAMDLVPAWTPQGERVTFSSNRAGLMDLYWISADGSEAETPLLAQPFAQWPTSWSPDGQRLAYTEEDPATGWDLWVLTGEAQRDAFLRTPFDERGATFSPDGRWLAYTSNESSRDEVYVRPFAGPGQKWQISTVGGSEPKWSRDGRELFYLGTDRVMAVAVATQPTFRAEKPRALFAADGFDQSPFTSFDVTADGQRFVMIRGEAAADPVPLHVVLNWFEELKRRVPAEANG